MYRDGEIRAVMEWRKMFLCSLMFLEKQRMYLLCSHLLKRLVKLPPESRGKWLDPKANLGFYTIVKNINKQYALISLKYLSSNNGILSTHSVYSFMQKFCVKLMIPYNDFAYSFFIALYQNNT